MISKHDPLSSLSRHRHNGPFLAVVLSGGFEEAGIGSRTVAAPGTALIRQGWEAHSNTFRAGGAEVLQLRLPTSSTSAVGDVEDADAIAALAERDADAALALALQQFRPRSSPPGDWPDLLARDLVDQRVTSLGGWAAAMGLRPQSLSRGFRQAYGVTPRRYWHELKLLRAIGRLRTWEHSIAELAADEGFADQAHLTRGVTALTGIPPAKLRVQLVQETLDQEI